jgi:DNA-directed RNA polymerase subunit RPC12/RpoP
VQKTAEIRKEIREKMEKKEEKMEANVVLCKCEKQHTFGIRVEKRSNDWFRTWAFKIDEKRIKREGFDKVVIKGSMANDPEYPGCPYCGGRGFFQCDCGRINCFKENEDKEKWEVTCNWCGKRLNVVRADTFEMRGGGL